uniref:YqgE/AlgH family protein n=1 Tax=Tetradesmus obliquus TaxID=3088 RepID=A0A383VTF1_TETOB|eukprot:jgi/Sobl393_1/9983/SZX68451.1
MLALQQVQPCLSCNIARRVRQYPRSALLHRTRAAGDDAGEAAETPTLYGDWREFRAKLVADAGKVNWASRVSEENSRLLQVQNPSLAGEETWAHATAQPEVGGLLLASRDVPDTDKYWQAVVLLVQHSPAGSVGLILNRPSSLKLGVGRGGLKFAIIGAPAGMQDTFAESRVYCGGMVRQDVFHILHGHNLEGSVALAPGVYVGGEAAAVKAVAGGLIAADNFKFFCGAMVWEGSELQQEIDKGKWYTAAGSRNLCLKQVLQLPEPLWREVLGLMGGEYASMAKEDDFDE